jgi:predicted RNA-binding protein with PUA-like domain
MDYWLMKSEPTVYSIADLEREKITLWDGVRNYQARNFLKKMQLGDRAFFYHSNTQPPGIVGLMQVVEILVVDPTQFDPLSDYFDPKSTPEQPRWYTVKLEFVEVFTQIITLEVLKQAFREEELAVVRKGNRLSVLPVATIVAEKILAMEQKS